MSFPYSDRIARAQALCASRDLAGVIVGTGSQFAYLTGSWMSSHERLTALIIPATGTPRIVAPLTDSASLTVDGVEVVGWRDGEDPFALATQSLVDDHSAPTNPVGLGGDLSVEHVFAFQELLPATTLAVDALAELFMVKDPEEIDELARAGAAIDLVHARVPDLLQPGRTEREVAAELERLILAEHDVVDFIIVGSGPNGANPHHSFSDRVLDVGDPVVVDIGGTIASGYHSDCTRTYVVGGPGAMTDPEFLAAYDAVHRAQLAACEAVRPGITAAELDSVARDIITEAGFGELFTHRLGHGIGLAGHEAPFIIQGNGQEIRENMAFSIEPGVYKPGAWGIRIEDIVVVSSQTAQYLNFQQKSLR